MGRWSFWLLLAGCGTPEAPAPTLEVHRGEGYTLQIPADARVRLEDGVLAVDARDGTRWFDVRWAEDASHGQAAIMTWAHETCETMLWDEVAEPLAGTRTTSGLCTIDHRQHWLNAVVEDLEGGTLVTVHAARRNAVPYETAWVDFVTTALSLTGADTPLTPLDEEAIEQRVRQEARTSPGGRPTPGGGVLSAQISRSLAEELWRPRRADPPPIGWGAPEG